MDFKLNDEQQLIQEMFQDFAQKEIKPIAAALDDEERFPAELIPQMAEIGLLGIPVAEEYGGIGMGAFECAMAVEELSKACAGTGATVAVHTFLVCDPIGKFGTEEQKQAYLPALASGEKLGAFALTEPNAGSDAAKQHTLAQDNGDHYLLNGSKIFITNGSYADVYLVFAATAKEKGKAGISTFIVEKGTQGFKFGTKEKKMGIRSSATYELIFEDCKVPKANLLGGEGQGYEIAMSALASGRIGIAAQAVGIAQSAIQETVEYTKQREQFGQRLSQFQNTQFELADMQVKVNAARLLVYQAAAARDARDSYGHLASMAKLFAAETASDVTRRCLQLFGGYGYTREYPMERMMRDAKITELYGGTNEVQKIVISGWMGVR